MAGFFDSITEFLAPATKFLSDNEALIGLGVTAGSAYYAYDQQQSAIEASERAQNQALALQQQQADREKAMTKLQAPTESASQIDLFSQNTRRKLSDFMYAPQNVSERQDAGIGLGDIKKAIGVA